MKKQLAVFLSGLAFAAATEEMWKYDFYSDKVAEIVKRRERFVSVCDSVLTFQIPARWMTEWGAVSLPLEFRSRKAGKPFSVRISGMVRLVDIVRNGVRRDDGVTMHLAYRRNGKKEFQGLQAVYQYGSCDWNEFSKTFFIPADAEDFSLLLGLQQCVGTLGIKDLVITEME